MKKVGILGGTFDPVHIGHLIAADQAIFYANLDEIWFMPAPTPPHKLDNKITPIEGRVEMLKRILPLESKYKLCTIELERSGPSYTLETIIELKTKYPDNEFHFIIGGDMIRYLPKWYGIDELIDLVNFIGLGRPGFQFEAKTEQEKKIIEKVTLIPMPQLEISSSAIRDWVKTGKEIRYFVTKSVEDYIKEKHLYES